MSIATVRAAEGAVVDCGSERIDGSPWPGGATDRLCPEDRRWVDGLTDRGSGREQTCRDLHAVLLRGARFEVRRPSLAARIGYADMEDVACQAASDALMLVMRKVGEFRGDSRFTTWANRFVAFEVKAKVRQHARRYVSVPLSSEHHDHVVEPNSSPDVHAEARELAEAIVVVLNTRFSAQQRAVFMLVLFSGMPAGVLGPEMGVNANAVHQTMFRARRHLRGQLLEKGFLQ